MIRYLFFCCVLSLACFAEEEPQNLLVSTPDQIATLKSSPDYLIGGLISPLSGQLVLSETDLVARGAESVYLTRTYIPPTMPSKVPEHKQNQAEYNKLYLHEALKEYRGWEFVPHARLVWDIQENEVRICEPCGATYAFKISEKGASLISPQFAITNVMEDRPSGQNDPRNIRLIVKSGGSRIIIQAPDGTIRSYQRQPSHHFRLLYLLEKETLPNGRILRYKYDSKRRLSLIEALDPREEHLYASIKAVSTQEGCHFITSTGLEADYTYQHKKLDVKIREKINGVRNNEEYHLTCPTYLTSVSSPYFRNEALGYNDSYLLNSVSGKKQIHTTEYSGFGKDPTYKIDTLSSPVGPNQAFKSIYKLQFTPPVVGKAEGSTLVKNNDHTATIFSYSKDLLIRASASKISYCQHLS